MNEDTKQLGIGGIIFVVLLGMVITGAIKCEAQRQKTLIECIKSGRTVPECQLAAKTVG